MCVTFSAFWLRHWTPRGEGHCDIYIDRRNRFFRGSKFLISILILVGRGSKMDIIYDKKIFGLFLEVSPMFLWSFRKVNVQIRNFLWVDKI